MSYLTGLNSINQFWCVSAYEVVTLEWNTDGL